MIPVETLATCQCRSREANHVQGEQVPPAHHRNNYHRRAAAQGSFWVSSLTYSLTAMSVIFLQCQSACGPGQSPSLCSHGWAEGMVSVAQPCSALTFHSSSTRQAPGHHPSATGHKSGPSLSSFHHLSNINHLSSTVTYMGMLVVAPTRTGHQIPVSCIISMAASVMQSAVCLLVILTTWPEP